MTVLWSKYCPKHQSPSHTCQSVMIKVFVSNYNCDWFWVFTKGEVGYLLANRTRNFHRSYNFIALFMRRAILFFISDWLETVAVNNDTNFDSFRVGGHWVTRPKFGFNRQLGSYLVTCQPRPIRGQNLLPVRLPEWVRSRNVYKKKQGGKLLLINFYERC